MSTLLDEYIARFQNLPSFNIYAVTESGMAVEPWFEVKPDDLVQEIVLDELNVATQVQSITAQIQKWGLLESRSRRVWEVEERGYRAWRSRFVLDLIEESEKKPSEKVIEATYRVDPEYIQWQIRIERAEEAHNATRAILEAFRAKRSMLERFAFRSQEDGAARLAV